MKTDLASEQGSAQTRYEDPLPQPTPKVSCATSRAEHRGQLDEKLQRRLAPNRGEAKNSFFGEGFGALAAQSRSSVFHLRCLVSVCSTQTLQMLLPRSAYRKCGSIQLIFQLCFDMLKRLKMLTEKFFLLTSEKQKVDERNHISREKKHRARYQTIVNG